MSEDVKKRIKNEYIKRSVRRVVQRPISQLVFDCEFLCIYVYAKYAKFKGVEMYII